MYVHYIHTLHKSGAWRVEAGRSTVQHGRHGMKHHDFAYCAETRSKRIIWMWPTGRLHVASHSHTQRPMPPDNFRPCGVIAIPFRRNAAIEGHRMTREQGKMPICVIFYVG